MIKGRDFIIFSDDWGRHPFSCQHVMQHFLPHNRLLWVNTIGMRNPRLTPYDLKRSVEKIRSWAGARHQNQAVPVSNLTVVSPVMTPYHNIGLVRGANRFSVLRTVKRATTSLGFKTPIVLATLPNAADYLGELSEDFSVYYCVDDFTCWPGVSTKLVKAMEERLIGKADMICASSEELCRIKTRNGRTPFLLPHGVNFAHFHAAARQATIKPKETRPIIGFFGALSAWLDYALLVELARLRPQFTFRFIGPVDTDIAMLARLPNVELVGKIAYHDLPRAAASFDVALIPFQVTKMTRSVNPLKLMEYLACGLPVVSVPLPEVVKHREVVELADTAQTFAQAIDKAMVENSDSKRQARLALAREYSWEAVAETLSTFIEQGIRSKGQIQS